MARTKIDPAISRKAYAEATSQLKKSHNAEFLRYLDAAYADLGVESPRARRQRLEDEAAEKRLLAAQKRKKREQEKLAEAAALLRSAGVQVALPGEEDEVLAS